MSRSLLMVAVGLLGAGPACGARAGAEGTTASSSPARTDRGSLGSSEAAPAPVPTGPALRVLTFNINYGVGHDPRNVEVVAQADADLVLLQETTAESERVFREGLGERYPHVLFRECCNAGGLGVLSKHPIREEVYLEPNVGWFPAWRVVVDTPLGLVQALDVHLRPPMSDGGSWVAGYFSTRDVRRDEIEDLWQAMEPGLPTLVAGDFNEGADGRAIAFLTEQGFRSALPERHPRAKTWEWTTKVGTIRAMLDHVVYSQGLALVDAQVIERGNSDHFPVLVTLAAAKVRP